MSDWYRLPDIEASGATADLVREVRRQIRCPEEHQVDIYRLAKWPRAVRITCPDCGQDTFVKTFGQDPVGIEEKQRRYDIERNNLEGLVRKGFQEGTFPSGSFNIPRLLSTLGAPHFALIEEYIGSATLSEAIAAAGRNGNDKDLLNALSLLAIALVTLHETTRIELPAAAAPGVNDPLRLLSALAGAGEYHEVISELYTLQSKWAQDGFFTRSLQRCLAHDGLTPVNLLFSPVERRLTITDLETLHEDTFFVDIGTVCAELKLSFMIHASNSYLAEPYIGYFLREYFAHLTKPELTYRQFTWVQAYFMGRRLLIISQGAWIWAPSVRRWCLDEVKNVWALIEQKSSFVPPPFVGAKAVFFDFYNTLVSVEDDEGDLKNFETVRSHIADTWPAMGWQFPSAETLRETYFSVIKEMVAASKEEYPDVDLELVWAETFGRLKVFPTLLIYENNRVRMREVLKVFRQSSLKRFEVFAGVREAISALRSNGIKIGIISDAQVVYVESELERSGILPDIDCFLFSAHFRLRKPDRHFFEFGLKRVGARPEEAVFVGDDMFRDIFGAKRIGMHTIYKPSEFGSAFYGAWVPDEVVTDFTRLPRLFGIERQGG